MKIQLTQGYEAIIDDEDYAKVKGYTWHAQVSKDANDIPYRVGAITSFAPGHPRGQTAESMARMILGLDYKDKRKVWFVNFNALDNRKENLRLRSVGEQLPMDNTTGFKGVYKTRTEGKWSALIVVERVTFCLGTFSDKLAAAKAYDDAALTLIGESAATNQRLGLY